MPAFRFFVPLLPLLYLAVAALVDVLLRQKRAYWRVAGVLVAGGVALATLSLPNKPRQHIQLAIMTAKRLTKTALWLNQHAEPGDVIAVVDAGAIPYYTGLSTIDMAGLNNYHIARQPVAVAGFKFDVDYVLAQRPQYIQIHTTPSGSGKGRLVEDFIGALYLYYNPEFARWYDEVTEVSWTQVYQRRKTPRTNTFLDDFYSIEYSGYPSELEGAAGTTIPFTLRVTNTGTGVWPTVGVKGGWGWVQVGYQLFSSDGLGYPDAPLRVPLPSDLAPDESADLSLTLPLPEQPGVYRLRVDPVVEMVSWFSDKGAGPLEIPVHVH